MAPMLRALARPALELRCRALARACAAVVSADASTTVTEHLRRSRAWRPSSPRRLATEVAEAVALSAELTSTGDSDEREAVMNATAAAMLQSCRRSSTWWSAQDAEAARQAVVAAVRRVLETLHRSGVAPRTGFLFAAVDALHNVPGGAAVAVAILRMGIAALRSRMFAHSSTSSLATVLKLPVLRLMAVAASQQDRTSLADAVALWADAGGDVAALQSDAFAVAARLTLVAFAPRPDMSELSHAANQLLSDLAAGQRLTRVALRAAIRIAELLQHQRLVEALLVEAARSKDGQLIARAEAVAFQIQAAAADSRDQVEALVRAALAAPLSSTKRSEPPVMRQRGGNRRDDSASSGDSERQARLVSAALEASLRGGHLDLAGGSLLDTAIRMVTSAIPLSTQLSDLVGVITSLSPNGAIDDQDDERQDDERQSRSDDPGGIGGRSVEQALPGHNEAGQSSADSLWVVHPRSSRDSPSGPTHEAAASATPAADDGNHLLPVTVRALVMLDRADEAWALWEQAMRARHLVHRAHAVDTRALRAIISAAEWQGDVTLALRAVRELRRIPPARTSLSAAASTTSTADGDVDGDGVDVDHDAGGDDGHQHDESTPLPTDVVLSLHRLLLRVGDVNGAYRFVVSDACSGVSDGVVARMLVDIAEACEGLAHAQDTLAQQTARQAIQQLSEMGVQVTAPRSAPLDRA